MPVTAESIENGHILKYTVTDPWTMEDVTAATRLGKQIYDASPHLVHVLVDVSQTRRIPRGFMGIRHVPDLKHPNSGHIAVVGAAGLMRAAAELLGYFVPGGKSRCFDTEADALAWLLSLPV
jgi:hypothetical protein